MHREPNGLVETGGDYQRVLGRIEGDPHGPTLVAMAAIHGNELAGVRAAQRVARALEPLRPLLRGRLILLAGNLAALARGTRFVDIDLNRAWTPAAVEALLADQHDGRTAAEHAEQLELIETLRGVVAESCGSIYFLDMHTSSAAGPPFITVGDTLRNRRFAEQFPLPLILGLEEQIDGSLLEYLNNHGFVTLGIEGGQHAGVDAVDRLEAVLWLALIAAGLIDEAQVPHAQRYRRLLVEASRGIPRVIEVRHRHAIVPGDRFRMDPGYANFARVGKQQVLARDRHGVVVAPSDGLLLLPLYQGQGDDGFFVARPVHPVWLDISGWLRTLRVGGLVRLLPGVRRHPRDGEVLVVNTRIARLYPLEVFHLFGFRKLRRAGIELTVSRRKHDISAPDRIRFC